MNSTDEEADLKYYMDMIEEIGVMFEITHVIDSARMEAACNDLVEV